MPFALDNVRIADLTWLLAGAGGPRMLTSLGAEDLRIEWKGHLDMIRASPPIIPVGEDRDRILGGQPGPGKRVDGGINQGGHFASINAGKRGVSLNLRHPEGKDLFKEIVRISDIVVECFTANTMERLGLGYDELRKVNPSIIYIQQPGFGKRGEYSDFVSTGPVAQAMSGLTEQSGLPAPWPPAGWGYSYMDWSGAYYCAMAMLSALYYRSRTGEGQYMDCSQAEPAIYMTGTAILDYVANGRESQRTGNASPYIPAAPHNVYPVQGEDRWLAIAVYDEDEWRALAGALGDPAWTDDERFASLASRLRHVKELDERLADETKQCDGFELMNRLQEAGVRAGLCQTAEDRMFHDPQLQHRGFQVELTNSFVGTWPVKDFPMKLSESPAYVGGTLDRHFPVYAEDNDYVYGELLNLPDAEVTRLRNDDVI